MKWEPLEGKQSLPLKTFILTSNNANIQIFKETEIYDTPGNGYFFISDILKRSTTELVEEITLMEAQQLRVLDKNDSIKNNVIGLTYGQNPISVVDRSKYVPYYKERESAVKWFYNTKRFDAALLSLKRTVMQYPILYDDKDLIELLFKLYDINGLYGFLYNETTWLLKTSKNATPENELQKWNNIARKKLTAK